MLKSIFAPPAPLYEDDLHYAGGGADEQLPDGWEDYSASGPGAAGEEGALEDTVETVLILSLGLGLMGLFWVRGRWAEQERERQRDEERRRLALDQQGEHGGQGEAGPAMAPAGEADDRRAGPIPPYII